METISYFSKNARLNLNNMIVVKETGRGGDAVAIRSTVLTPIFLQFGPESIIKTEEQATKIAAFIVKELSKK